MNVDSRHNHGDGPQPPPPQQQPQSSSGGTSRKIGLSCAECRRSKLKCDRIFPCQSCVRRGCAGICPEGTLAATKGNKVLMAHAQRLQEQVKALTAKNNELEAQLVKAGLRPEIPRQPGEGSQGLRSAEPEENGTDGIGSLSIGINGQAKYHGESAGSEYLQDLLPSSQGEFSSSYRHPPDLPPAIQDLLHAFPFGFRDCSLSADVFLPFLPERDHAIHLSNLYFTNIGWMYEPISRLDYTSTVLDSIYMNGDRRLDKIHSHRLAVFFIIIANGAVFEESSNAELASRTFHALARAAFSLNSILVEATSATVQALFLIVRFLYNADRDRNEERWLITGLNCRLAHMIGLQRDSASWNLPADEVQRRRQIFWELFTWDAWTGVVNGRPAALAVQHTDCQFPEDLEPVALPGKEQDLGWHAWKLRYAANILTASSFHVFNPRTPPYDALLDLDKKIRAFPLPAHLRSPVKNSDTGRSWHPDSVKAMQQYCAICTRESNLLYIHRSYFAQALRQQPENPLYHRYAASVMAAYRAATRLIGSLRSLYAIHPHPTGHVWYFWSGIFSSCIVLGALVVESPKCTLSADALRELGTTIPFFEQGSRVCRSQGSVPILEKLLQRATTAYQSQGNQVRPPSADLDELHVLGGRKSIIKPPSRAGSSPHTGPGTPTSHRDEDSPKSHLGAEEMLAEYLGHAPGSFQGNKYEYNDAPNPATYGEEGYAARSMGGPGGAGGGAGGGGPSMVQQQQQQPYMRTYVSPPGSVMAADAPGNVHYSQRSPQSTMSQGSDSHHYQYHASGPPPPGQQWHASSTHSPPSPHQQHPHPSSHQTTSMYGHPLDVNHPQAYNPIIQRYGPGMPHQRTQEEIWRDFMMGYNQPS